jgi:hypothetical protein
MYHVCENNSKVNYGKHPNSMAKLVIFMVELNLELIQNIGALISQID